MRRLPAEFLLDALGAEHRLISSQTSSQLCQRRLHPWQQVGQWFGRQCVVGHNIENLILNVGGRRFQDQSEGHREVARIDVAKEGTG